MNLTRQLLLILGTGIAWSSLGIVVFFWVPSDAQQGVIQRVFYFHMPTAITSFVAFIVAFVFSILYLRRRELDYDTRAMVFTMVGWIFTTGVLITGPLWARPIWGHYWDWSDERLVFFFVMWLIYSGYVVLRGMIPDPHKRARLSAVLSILGFPAMIMVYFSIRIWNTPSHPGPVMGGDEKSGLGDPRMHVALWYAMFCFGLLFAAITSVFASHVTLKHRILEKKYQ